MKTPEEWYKENNMSGEFFALLTQSDIRAIQSDARRSGVIEGMRRAAGIAANWMARCYDAQRRVQERRTQGVQL